MPSLGDRSTDRPINDEEDDDDDLSLKVETKENLGLIEPREQAPNGQPLESDFNLHCLSSLGEDQDAFS